MRWFDSQRLRPSGVPCQSRSCVEPHPTGPTTDLWRPPAYALAEWPPLAHRHNGSRLTRTASPWPQRHWVILRPVAATHFGGRDAIRWSRRITVVATHFGGRDAIRWSRRTSVVATHFGEPFVVTATHFGEPASPWPRRTSVNPPRRGRDALR